jgi:hypothetical protein
MKKIINKILTTVGYVLGIALPLALCWYCSSCSKERTDTAAIPETNLTVLHSETTTYGTEDVTVVDFFYLMQGTDTLAARCCMMNPYVNLRGIVYVPENGIYDCRNGRFSCILAVEDDPGLVPYVSMKADEGSDELYIAVGYSQLRNYVYDLRINRISEL